MRQLGGGGERSVSQSWEPKEGESVASSVFEMNTNYKPTTEFSSDWINDLDKTRPNGLYVAENINMVSRPPLCSGDGRREKVVGRETRVKHNAGKSHPHVEVYNVTEPVFELLVSGLSWRHRYSPLCLK